MKNEKIIRKQVSITCDELEVLETMEDLSVSSYEEAIVTGMVKQITKKENAFTVTKTRVYAIDESLFNTLNENINEDIHDISNDEFMDIAEEQGNVWSLSGFQNVLNTEGSGHLDFHKLKTHYFRFIDVEVSL